MNWIRFRNRLFGFRIEINEPDRVQFQTDKPLGFKDDMSSLIWTSKNKVNPAFCPLDVAPKLLSLIYLDLQLLV